MAFLGFHSCNFESMHGLPLHKRAFCKKVYPWPTNYINHTQRTEVNKAWAKITSTEKLGKKHKIYEISQQQKMYGPWNVVMMCLNCNSTNCCIISFWKEMPNPFWTLNLTIFLTSISVVWYLYRNIE